MVCHAFCTMLYIYFHIDTHPSPTCTMFCMKAESFTISSESYHTPIMKHTWFHHSTLAPRIFLHHSVLLYPISAKRVLYDTQNSMHLYDIKGIQSNFPHLNQCLFRLLISHLEAEILMFKNMYPSLPYTPQTDFHRSILGTL